MNVRRLMDPGGGTLTPEDVAKIVEANKALEAQNKTLADSNKAMQGKFAELSGQVAQALQNQNRPAPVVADPEPELEPNARRALERLIDAKMKPAVDVVMNNEETRQLVELAGLEFYGDYKDEIDQVMAQAAPGARARAGFAKAAYDYVMGKHLDEVVAKKVEKASKKVEFTETTSSAAPNPKRDGKLSAEEKVIAERTGQSEADYIAWRDDPDGQAAKLLERKVS